MKVLTVTMDWSCPECEWKHSEPVIEASLRDLPEAGSTEAEAQRAAATERMAKAIINHFCGHHPHLARTQ
jgi:Zn-finger protein